MKVAKGSNGGILILKDCAGVLGMRNTGYLTPTERRMDLGGYCRTIVLRDLSGSGGPLKVE